MARVDRASRLILAPPAWVYRALTDPDLLVKWLPPAGARGKIDAFEARPGGAFAITLTFDVEGGAKGKSSPQTDVVKGRFVDLEADRQVSQSFEFDSADPGFVGTMRMIWTLEPAGENTLLSVAAENAPSGISAEDHAAGLASSLAKLGACGARARLPLTCQTGLIDNSERAP